VEVGRPIALVFSVNPERRLSERAPIMVDQLKAGESLKANESLISRNGASTLLMQGDGNLVLYRGAIDISTAYWSTDTWGLPDDMRPVRALMQTDGHFVLYDASDVPRWSSGTWVPLSATRASCFKTTGTS
jgi:hypothetical protein